MASPAEKLPSSEPSNPEHSEFDDTYVAQYDLIKLAEYVGQGREYVASFTSFLGSKMFSLDDAIHMLGFSNIAEVKQKLLAIKNLEELRKQQTENIRTNVERSRHFGGSVITTVMSHRPLRYLKRQ
jgi:hypothetical protein